MVDTQIDIQKINKGTLDDETSRLADDIKAVKKHQEAKIITIIDMHEKLLD